MAAQRNSDWWRIITTKGYCINVMLNSYWKLHCRDDFLQINIKKKYNQRSYMQWKWNNDPVIHKKKKKKTAAQANINFPNYLTKPL